MRFLERLLEFMIFQSIWKGIEMITNASLKFISDNLLLWFYVLGALILAVYMVVSYIRHPFKRFAFDITKKIFPKRHEVLSAHMRNGGRGRIDGADYLSWDLVAKLHINTTKPITIVFDKCTAELKHKQYKDIQSNFSDIMLIEEEYRNNEVYVYEKFRELEVSQIVIDKPSIVTLLAMFTTSVWMPGDKESVEVLFKLPVSEMNYKSIKVSVGMLKVGQGMDFETP